MINLQVRVMQNNAAYNRKCRNHCPANNKKLVLCVIALWFVRITKCQQTVAGRKQMNKPLSFKTVFNIEQTTSKKD